MTREIPLTKGKVALVDDADFDWLNQWRWRAGCRGDAQFYAVKDHGGKAFMHKLILGLPSGQKGDHINGNTLDNRRSNLRPCTQLQNSQNRRKTHSACTSQYKGVHLLPNGKWKSVIYVNKRCLQLGSFVYEIDAAKAYDAAAREHFGEFAYLNFPDLVAA